jgi:hypothetical protein
MAGRRTSKNEFDAELDRLGEWLDLAREGREEWYSGPYAESLRSAYIDGIKTAAALLEQKGHPGLARDVKKLAKTYSLRSTER